METQDILERKIGTKEAESLKPADVIVKAVRVDNIDIKGKNHMKLIATVLHPDRNETIDISSVKYEKKGKLECSGLWVKTDDENNIQKGTALASLLGFHQVEMPSKLTHMSLPTIEDEKGFLCFKAY